MPKHSWGFSENLHADEFMRVDLIRGRKGGRSSNHLHRFLDNSLLVVSGIVVIHSGRVGDESEAAYLIAGKSYTTPSGKSHRIEFLEDSVAVETYHVSIYLKDEVLPEGFVLNDIVRFDEGTP
tara:strand:- start:479 stop:847 length:369 start_codon:yes stop_codon:yes gene_type:complete